MRKYRREARSYSPAFLVLPLLALLLLPAAASAYGEGEPGDVVFRAINATTGEPCILDRLTLQESTPQMTTVGDTEPTAPVFTFGGVPLVDARGYIATAWFEEVPYYFEFRGRHLDQDTNTVHVFATTPEVKDVAISGLNLLVGKQGELVKLEYMLQVENRIRPQTTVVHPSAVLELPVPAGARIVEASYRRAPTPTPIRTRRIGDTSLELNLPLTPGRNQLRVQAMVEWSHDLSIPVGCSVPIESWSLLGSPDWLEFQCFELEADTEGSPSGYARYKGPALDAGREISVRVSADRAPAPEEDLFADSDTAAADTGAEAAGGGSDTGRRMPPVLPFAALFLIVAIVWFLRRRKG